MVEVILNRLQGVKQKATHKWLAKCPAHDDRSPSLWVRLADDDKVLIHCFGGCQVADVVASVGLELSDLFPKQASYGKATHKPRFNAADLLSLCVQESMILVVALGDCWAGRAVSDEDQARIQRAVDTLFDIRQEVRKWR